MSPSAFPSLRMGAKPTAGAALGGGDSVLVSAAEA